MKVKLRAYIKRYGVILSLFSILFLYCGIFFGFAPVYNVKSTDINTYMIIFGGYNEFFDKVSDAHLVLLIPFISLVVAAITSIIGFIFFAYKENYQKASLFLKISTFCSLFSGIFFLFSYAISETNKDILFGYFLTGIPIIISSLLSLPEAFLKELL